MNIHLALLLTHDADFEKVLTESLKESGAEILMTHDVDHALEIGCRRGAELDLAVIDRSDCHAITLLGAIKACRHDLPVVVVTSSDACAIAPRLLTRTARLHASQNQSPPPIFAFFSNNCANRNSNSLPFKKYECTSRFAFGPGS